MSTESVPDSFLIHSDREIVYANPPFCVLVGAESQEQLVNTSLTDLLAPEYRSTLREQITRIENHDAATLGLTVEFQTLTGQLQRAIVVSSLVEWDGTEQVQTSVFPIAGGGTDADSRRPLHDQTMDEAPIGISIADPNGKDNPIIYANDGFSELTGYPLEEVLGQNCRFLQGEHTREEPVAQMREAIDNEEPVTVELRNYRKDGSMFWNRVTIIPIRSDSGTVTNWLGYQQDITAEKRYEQDLSLFKEQAKEADKSIFITDSDGTIEYVNPAFETITGYTADEAVGRTPRILKSGQQDEAFYAELWDQITAGEVWEAELTNQTKYGELFEVKQKIVPVTDEHGEITHFVAIEQDVTEKVLTTQTLDVLNRVLRHNLRNSLNAIDGHAELLEDECLDPEARKASVAAIRNQAASMQQIAEKTAEIRSIWDPTEAHETWEELDVESLVETYQRQYPEADITSIIDGDGVVRAQSAELLKKAVDEAVTNAIEHADRSPPEVTVTVQHSPTENQFRVRVTDTGPGIPELERQTIESGGETPLGHSLGIDLWLMEWITTTLGGELTIEDNEPRGSVVTFQLPSGSSNTA